MIDSCTGISKRVIRWLGLASTLLLGLMVVTQTMATITNPSQVNAPLAADRAPILPEQRDDRCLTPPALTNQNQLAVTITATDDSNGGTAPTIYVNALKDSSNNPLPVVTTLKDIQTALTVLGPSQANLLTEVISGTDHIWTLKMHLQADENVTIRVSGGATGAAQGAQVDWLRLRSDPSPGYPILSNPSDPNSNKIYDYTSFAALRGRDGSLFIENTKITSWDTVNNALDTNDKDGRPFILVRENASMNVCSSEIAYLGFFGGQAYGLAWRDPSTVIGPDGKKTTRVTGDMINSRSHDNYYGVYTFQAKDMIFRNNKFYNNVQYGFDPHDFTTDVLVQDNESFANGDHGFIISRGCTNFVFQRNKSHNNIVRENSKNPSAHGFMLDPGSPNAGPQTPSTNNVYEENEAYDNQGYGFRLLDADNNTIRNNKFYNNWQGISVESDSRGNTFDGNQITNNAGQKITPNGINGLKGGYGIHVYSASDINTITNNIITGNATIGISLEVGNTLVQGNTITGNGTPDPLFTNKKYEGVSITVDTEPTPTPESVGRNGTGDTDIRPDERLPADDYLLPDSNSVARQAIARAVVTPPVSNKLLSNTINTNTTNGVTLKGATGTQIMTNTITANLADGISMTANTTTTRVEANTIRTNGSYGIEVAGTTGTRLNTITKNVITGNGTSRILGTGGYGISVRNTANDAITKLTNINVVPATTTVTGIAKPGATVEIFTDGVDEGEFYVATVTADATTGAFSFTFTAPPQGSFMTATQTDSNGNTSPFSSPKLIGTAPPATATSTPTTTTTATNATTTATSTSTTTATNTETTTATSTPTTTETNATTTVTSTPTTQPKGTTNNQVLLPVVKRP